MSNDEPEGSPAATQKSFVSLDRLSRVFPSKARTGENDASGDVLALCEVTFTLERGQRIALLGRSGSGKSTLLNLLSGIDRPTSGSICVDGQELSGLTRDELASYRLNTVGFVFQAFNLISTLTALQNVELPFQFAGVEPRTRHDRAMKALTSVGMEKRALHRPDELSGGEQQRVAVARALVNQPSLLLADEPTGNLDSRTAKEVMKLLVDHSDANQTTMVLVTHDEALAGEFAHRTVRMADGRIIPE